jgi:hypothetical protein
MPFATDTTLTADRDKRFVRTERAGQRGVSASRGALEQASKRRGGVLESDDVRLCATRSERRCLRRLDTERCSELVEKRREVILINKDNCVLTMSERRH